MGLRPWSFRVPSLFGASLNVSMPRSRGESYILASGHPHIGHFSLRPSACRLVSYLRNTLVREIRPTETAIHDRTIPGRRVASL